MNINIKQEMIDAHIIENYETELKEMATFLHEDVAQNLYAVFNHLQYLQQHIVDKKNRTTIDDMVKLTKKTIEEIRILSNDAHPFFHNGVDGALKVFSNNYSKKHGIAVEYKSHGEKQRLQRITELIVYRTFKDILNQICSIVSSQRIEVTSIWGKSLDLKIQFTTENNEMLQTESFLLNLLGVEKKLKLVEGSISTSSSSETKRAVNIFIPNVRGCK